MKRNVILQWLGYNWILNFPSLYWTHWISLVTLRVFNVIYWYLQCTSPSALVLRGGGLGQERRRDNLIKCKYNTLHYNFHSPLLRSPFVLDALITTCRTTRHSLVLKSLRQDCWYFNPSICYHLLIYLRYLP